MPRTPSLSVTAFINSWIPLYLYVVSREPDLREDPVWAITIQSHEAQCSINGYGCWLAPLTHLQCN